MNRFIVVIAAAMLLEGCVSTSVPSSPAQSLSPAKTKDELDANVRKIMARTPGMPFYGAHFIGIEPGVTTREQMIEVFGEPYATQNLGPLGMQDTWIEGHQVVITTSKEGVLSQVQSVANVKLGAETRRRLGL